jgi:hypothetical protein
VTIPAGEKKTESQFHRERSSSNSEGSPMASGCLRATSEVLPKGSSARAVARHRDERLTVSETSREGSGSNVSRFGSSNQLLSSSSIGFSSSFPSDFGKNIFLTSKNLTDGLRFAPRRAFSEIVSKQGHARLRSTSLRVFFFPCSIAELIYYNHMTRDLVNYYPSTGDRGLVNY